LTLSFYIKKAVFLRGCREPPHFSSHLAKISCSCMQLAVLIHCFFGVRVFSVPESLPSDLVADSAYYAGTTYDSALSSMSDDVFIATDWIARLDFVNTHPQAFVIVVIVAVSSLRVLFFIFRQTVIAIAQLFVALLSSDEVDTEKTRTTSRCSQFRETKFGVCLVTTLNGLHRFVNFVGSLIADFTSASLDSVFMESFSTEPLEYFKKKKIPYSYNMMDVDADLSSVVSGKSMTRTKIG
jgi:uncharacterized membrane protein